MNELFFVPESQSSVCAMECTRKRDKGECQGCRRIYKGDTDEKMLHREVQQKMGTRIWRRMNLRFVTNVSGSAKRWEIVTQFLVSCSKFGICFDSRSQGLFFVRPSRRGRFCSISNHSLTPPFNSSSTGNRLVGCSWQEIEIVADFGKGGNQSLGNSNVAGNYSFMGNLI